MQTRAALRALALARAQAENRARVEDTPRPEGQRPGSATSPIPARFADFLAWIGVTTTPGQADIVSQAYDATSRARVVVVVSGRRAGKSYVLVALRLLHGLLTRDVSSCAPGQVPTALVMAPNDTLRAEVINYALGAMQSHEQLSPMIRGKSAAQFDVMRPDGKLVRFLGGVSTHGGYGARGRSLTDCALDEVAFFRDRSARVNDEDIFRAALPGVLPGGQVILASTPWVQKGLLYELWSRNRETSKDAAVFHAPTLALRPEMAELVATETERDPDNAKREYGAEFVTGNSLAFFDADLLERAVDDGLDCDILIQEDGDREA